jgi:hypothetical protein
MLENLVTKGEYIVLCDRLIGNCLAYASTKMYLCVRLPRVVQKIKWHENLSRKILASKTSPTGFFHDVEQILVVG